MMIAGRVGQGFTGGAMIPTSMTIIATRLPRPQQPVGTALFGSTLILGPVLGPLAGGWLTENYSWHYAFFINIPVCIVLMIFDRRPQAPENAAGRTASRRLAGHSGMAAGLGGLTIVLEEGNREQWFRSTLIWRLSAVTAAGFIMIGLGQVFAKRPVVRLALLRNRAFAAVFVLGLVVGSVLYGVLCHSAVPGGDRRIQCTAIGRDRVPVGHSGRMMMPLFPILVAKFDLRAVVATGLLLMAASCWFDTTLTAQSDGSEFVISQLLRGLGQALSMLFLNQAAIASVKPNEAGDASGLFNAARNLGGSIALALLATLQERRVEFHHWTIYSAMPANDVGIQDWVASETAKFGTGFEAVDGAIRSIDSTVLREAMVMSFSDEFTALAVAIVIVVPLVLLLRPLPKGPQKMAMH
jgi:DHA2 family multidrug resistance protein